MTSRSRMSRRVLVTDAATNHALALTRSLGAKGIGVTACEDRRLAKSFYSQFCRDSFVYPCPRTSVSQFVDRVVERANTGNYDVLFPMTEKAMLPLSLQRHRLSPSVKMPIPTHEAIVRAFDKAAILELADALCIPTPKTVKVDAETGLRAAAKRLGFPLAMKSSTSERMTEDDRILPTSSTRYVFGGDDLEHQYGRMELSSGPKLLQEFVPGEGYGIFALFNDGKPRAWFAHRRLRDVVATGSGSAFRESIPIDGHMKEYAERLLTALQWHGVAMVEFKLDSRDDVPKLMEVNGRFWNSLPLAIAAGVDFPFLLYRLAVDGDIEPVESYEVGVRCRWLLGDLRHLLSVVKGPPAGWPGKFPQRWETLRAVLRGFDASVYDDDFVRGDLTPGFVGFMDFLATKVPAFLIGGRRPTIGRA
jgi:predicted ATP-grasp superfamily ATP-dependent carboligase